MTNKNIPPKTADSNHQSWNGQGGGNQNSQGGSRDGHAGAAIPAAKMAEYCRRIVSYLEEGKPFYTAGYSMWELARATGISVKMISASINHYLGRNFYDLINRMRIEEAKKMLREMAACDSKAMIEEVGFRCGFRSRSVFFSRFKEYEKTTPCKYMNLYRNELKSNPKND